MISTRGGTILNRGLEIIFENLAKPGWYILLALILFTFVALYIIIHYIKRGRDEVAVYDKLFIEIIFIRCYYCSLYYTAYIILLKIS